MATTLASDFQIYDALFHTQRVETIQQEVDVFNQNSAGAMVMRARDLQGHYEKESFFTDSLTDSRRDITADTSVTATKIGDDEEVSVKLNRRQGPHQYSIDAFKKKGMTAEDASIALGQQSGAKQAQAMVSNLATSLEAAIRSVGTNDLVADQTGTALSFQDISAGRRLFGDSSTDLVAALIHGDKFHDLVDDGLANYKIENVAGSQIVTGDLPGAMGLTLIVTDEPALITSGSPDTYHTILLQRGAATAEESEDPTMADETITGNENLKREWQMEYAFNVSLRGFKWDTTNGGINPDASTLGTGTNWDKAANNNKSLSGVIVDSD